MVIFKDDLRAISSRHHFAVIVESPGKPGTEIHSRFVADMCLYLCQIRTAAIWIIDQVLGVVAPAKLHVERPPRAAGDLRHHAGDVKHGALLGVADVVRLRRPAFYEHTKASGDEIAHVTERAGRSSVAQENDRAALERRGHHIGHHTPIVETLARPVDVEGTYDLGGHFALRPEANA